MYSASGARVRWLGVVLSVGAVVVWLSSGRRGAVVFVVVRMVVERVLLTGPRRDLAAFLTERWPSPRYLYSQVALRAWSRSDRAAGASGSRGKSFPLARR